MSSSPVLITAKKIHDDLILFQLFYYEDDVIQNSMINRKKNWWNFQDAVMISNTSDDNKQVDDESISFLIVEINQQLHRKQHTNNDPNDFYEL